MRIFDIFTSDKRKTDEERTSAVREGKAARAAIDKQFDALFHLMDETLQSVRQIEHKPDEKKSRNRKCKK